MKYIVFLLLLVLSIWSCSPKEKIINPIDTAEKILVATDEEQPKLKIIEIPSLKELNSDLFKDIPNLAISSPVENIKEFGGNLYIFIPGDNKIHIIKKYDMSLLSTIDFTDDKYEPLDVVFPNSTDAYIIHKNSIYVTLLDITNFQIARSITVGNPPHSIAHTGNQIYVTNRPDNSISVIDSRDRREVEKIITEPNPVFVKMTNDSKNAIVVCAGMGKFETDENLSPAYVQSFNIENRSINYSYELGFAQIPALDQIPLGLVVTSKDWGFIPTQDNFLRIDVRTSDKINLITKRQFYYISQDTKNERLILLRELEGRSDILFADDRTGEIGDFYSLPYKIKLVYPY